MSGRSSNRREVRLAEWMVVAAVMGILGSLALPRYAGMQRHTRIESLLYTASAASEDLPDWISASLHGERGALVTDQSSASQHEARSAGNARVLDAFARVHNERFLSVSPLTRQPLFVVEPEGTRADQCPRDGRIHLIPVAAPDGRILGTHLIVTNTERKGGPCNDGILSSSRVWAGQNGAQRP